MGGKTPIRSEMCRGTRRTQQLTEQNLSAHPPRGQTLQSAQLLCSNPVPHFLQPTLLPLIHPPLLSALVMLNRACRILQSVENPGTASASGAAAAAGLSESERIARWRTLIIKMQLLFQMIAMQTKVKCLLGQAVFDQLLPTATAAASSSQQPIKYRIIKEQIVGKPLPPGEGPKDQKTAHMDPAMCAHNNADMMPRGNAKNQWWTCKKCLTRWERLPVSAINSMEAEPQDGDLVTFGKFMGSTYLEVLQQAPEYCAWVSQTQEQGESSPALQRLAHYIYQKHMAATFEADDFDLEM